MWQKPFTTLTHPARTAICAEDTHIGIVGGWDESGNIQIIHCASGHNNVVISEKVAFTTIGGLDYHSKKTLGGAVDKVQF